MNSKSANENTGGNISGALKKPSEGGTEVTAVIPNLSHDPKSWNFLESWVPSLVTISIFLVCTTLQWAYICTWYIRNHSTAVWLPVVIGYGVTTLCTVVNYLYASYMNPGFLPKSPDKRYLKRQPSRIKVNGTVVHLKHCRTCNYYRMPRTVHCHQCNYCVDNFDHHCPWVNNCVARRNYRFFFAFLCCVTTHILATIGMCVFYLLQYEGAMLEDWGVEKTVAVVVPSVAGIIFIPVVGLLCFHIFLVWNGFTTNEYVTKKYKDKSPFDMGPCENFAFQLCGPEYPVFNPPKFALEENGRASQEVQRELVAKFADTSGNRRDRDNSGYQTGSEKLENLSDMRLNSINHNFALDGGGDTGAANLDGTSDALQSRAEGRYIQTNKERDCNDQDAVSECRFECGGDRWNPNPTSVQFIGDRCQEVTFLSSP